MAISFNKKLLSLDTELQITQLAWMIEWHSNRLDDLLCGVCHEPIQGYIFLTLGELSFQC